MKAHELKIETIACGTYYEFRATCSCGWGPRIAEQIEYLTASWIMHEREWYKEQIIELEACLRDAYKLVGKDKLTGQEVGRWARWCERLTA